jgi:hypothetical protein
MYHQDMMTGWAWGGMWLFWILVLVLIGLSIAALIKYLRS